MSGIQDLRAHVLALPWTPSAASASILRASVSSFSVGIAAPLYLSHSEAWGQGLRLCGAVLLVLSEND